MDTRGTFNLLRIVDDEIAVPYDGEVHCQVTDLHTLVHVLKSRTQSKGSALSGSRVRESQREIEDRGEKREKNGVAEEDRVEENERMKGQQRDEAFNHLSFLPWLSAHRCFDM